MMTEIRNMFMTGAFILLVVIGSVSADRLPPMMPLVQYCDNYCLPANKTMNNTSSNATENHGTLPFTGTEITTNTTDKNTTMLNKDVNENATTLGKNVNQTYGCCGGKMGGDP